MSCVLDSSVALAWIFDDERTLVVDALIADVLASGPVVPGIWPVEVANVLMMSARGKRAGKLDVTASLGDLRSLRVHVDQETNERAWHDTLNLATPHMLTLYDATYLELAIRLQVPLATFDKDLRTAAAMERVPLL